MGTENTQEISTVRQPADAPAHDQQTADKLNTLGGQLLASRDAAGGPGDPDAAQKAYDKAHGQWEKQDKVFWDKVTDAKKNHQFVLEFPPVYDGPPKPKTAPPEHKPNSIPTINQMLADSKHLNQFAFGDAHKPQYHLRQVEESEFKKRYAEEAVNIGQQHGLSKADTANIVRGIYAFEDGGWGTHETLSNMPSSLVKADQPGQTTIRDARRNFHSEAPTASSAIGYNQLLTATTLGDIEGGSKMIADRLDQLAKQDPARATELHAKAVMVAALGPSLHKELLNMASEEIKKDPTLQKKYLDADGNPTEQLYGDFAKSKGLTAAGLSRMDMARAIHGLNLDGDIGPIIQAHELSNLLDYAAKYNYKTLLSATEQGDAKTIAAYDALPASQKTAAVSEVMGLVKGPAIPADPVADPAGQAAAQEFAATKAALTAKLGAMQPGVDKGLERDALPARESELLRTKVLTLRDFGEPTGVLSAQAQMLLTKVAGSYYGGLTATNLMPAALELANLAGPKNASQMLDYQNKDVPTPNFFSRAGYNANPVTRGRTGAELLLQIQRAMKGPYYSAQNPGQADFEKAFDAL